MSFESTSDKSQLLVGKTALVTGAARGLGAAIAASCVAHGAHTILTDVLDGPLRETAALLGPTAEAIVLDVTDPASWNQLTDHLATTIGRPDVLVNNAGIILAAPIESATHQELMRTLDVNVGGTFLGIQTFVQLHHRTRSTQPGSIINISSVRGIIGGSRAFTYSASKFAVRGLTKAAAVELGPLQIRVNAVCPGPIESEMSRGNPQFADLDWDAYTTQLPLGRIGQPRDIGEAVAWLGSDASGFITGVDLPVDGGLTATSFSVTQKRQSK